MYLPSSSGRLGNNVVGYRRSAGIRHPLTIRRQCRTHVYNSLHIKCFHDAQTENVHECSLNSTIGKATVNHLCNNRSDTLLKIAPRLSYAVESLGSSVTVGQPPSAELCVSNMPSLKAKKLRKP